jgi:hypothetical protein
MMKTGKSGDCDVKSVPVEGIRLTHSTSTFSGCWTFG